MGILVPDKNTPTVIIYEPKANVNFEKIIPAGPISDYIYLFLSQIFWFRLPELLQKESDAELSDIMNPNTQ